MIKCCFYGSLRRPMYNYQRMINSFGKDTLLYLKTMYIKGWELYSLSGLEYPGIREAHESKTIVVDLFLVEPKIVYPSIKSMETSANFYEDEILADGNVYKIFPFAGEVKRTNLVDHGDWLLFMNENKLSKDAIRY